MYLIHLLLPIHSNNGEKFPADHFQSVRETLTTEFGGVTAFVRSPAIGLWKGDDENVSRDDVVMFEVVSPELDKNWWAKYRSKLEREFHQDEILIWSSEITKL
jgi:hypothetical protein